MTLTMHPNWFDGRTYTSVMVPIYRWGADGVGAFRYLAGYVQMWRVQP